MKALYLEAQSKMPACFRDADLEAGLIENQVIQILKKILILTSPFLKSGYFNLKGRFIRVKRHLECSGGMEDPSNQHITERSIPSDVPMCKSRRMYGTTGSRNSSKRLMRGNFECQ